VHLHLHLSVCSRPSSATPPVPGDGVAFLDSECLSVLWVLGFFVGISPKLGIGAWSAELFAEKIKNYMKINDWVQLFIYLFKSRWIRKQ
jgi:hypothetical protein